MCPGSYPVQEIGLTVGFYTELSEEEFPNDAYDKDINDDSNNKIFKLVFKVEFFLILFFNRYNEESDMLF